VTRDTHPRPRTATRGLGALLRVPGLPDLVLPVLLRYSADDPYAVRLVLLPDGTGDESVDWLFARSLLTEGLTAPVGQGDVRVQVVGREVAVELAGEASVLLPLDGLVEFLADSYEVVATGSESCAAQLDRELARMLG
jgi:hypothetical protein